MKHNDEMFHQGKYQSQLTLLQQEVESATDLLTQLRLQQNIVVCKYMLDTNEYSIEESLNCFKDIICKCSSIPPSKDVVSTELTCVYNYMYLHMVYANIEDTAYVYKQMVNTLSRVEQIDGCTDKISPRPPGTRHNCYILLDKCLQYLPCWQTADVYGMIEPLCGCSWLLCILDIKTGDHTPSTDCLDTLTQTLKNFTPPTQSPLRFMIPLQLDHQVIRLSSTLGLLDLTSFLLGVCHCRHGRWTECHVFMETIADDSIKVAADFVSGYSLYRLSDYCESVALLMQLLRSPHTISQQLKARIYNLIGSCFNQLSKVQLSIQMYKEALSTDFSYLVPLYNTSLQYRKLANHDMELECLNLLVKAIEMQEEKRPIRDGIDVLDLINMGDRHISYTWALYSLANRCLQLHRYDVASDNYMELMTHLKSWKTDIQSLHELPPLLQIHHEAILSLLESRRYSQCLTLCNTVIACYHRNKGGNHNDLNITSASSVSQELSFFAHDNTDISISLETGNAVNDSGHRTEKYLKSNHIKGKRKFSDIEAVDDSMSYGTQVMNVLGDTEDKGGDKSEQCVYDEDIIALKYKADVLVNTGETTAALECLERAMDSMHRYKRNTLAKVCIEKQDPDQPPPKRARVSEDPLQMTLTPKAALGSPNSHLELEYDLYTHTADILTSQDMTKDARHFYRLAAQIKPESAEKT